MLKYCDTLEKLHKKSDRDNAAWIFEHIKQWYIRQHEDFEKKIKNDLRNVLCEEFEEASRQRDNHRREMENLPLGDAWVRYLSPFTAADVMCKQLLCRYSYGFSENMEGIEYPKNKKRESCCWTDSRLSVHDLYELAQHQLQRHGEGQRINISVLMEARSQRSSMVHRGESGICTSAVRMCNTLREMLVLMDPELERTLPRFSYPEDISRSTQLFLDRFETSFKTEHTVLVAGSLHDIPAEQRRILADMTWTLVLDFDGCTDHGGLKSVAHKAHIHSQKLTPDTAREYRCLPNYTTWFTSGDLCSYWYARDSSEDFWFRDKEYFADSSDDVPDMRAEIFKNLMGVLAGKQTPVNILVIHPDTRLVKDLLKACGTAFHGKNYKFSCLYYHPEYVWEGICDDLNENGGRRYRINGIVCDLDSFFRGLPEYEGRCPSRTTLPASNRLPSVEGLVPISANTALNLSEFFDVVYADAGDRLDRDQIKEFYQGGPAPWCAFQHGYAVPTLPDTEYWDCLKMVDKALEKKLEKGKKNIVNILHSPGIGGSTLLRRIGWDRHLEYPVLLVRKYDAQIADRIVYLYDQLKTSILILADEAIGDTDRLKDMVQKLDRPCVLVVAGRRRSLKCRQGEAEFVWKAIPPRRIDPLKERFSDYSVNCGQLSEQERIEKDRQFDSFIKQDNSLQCPFMIGLYYLDKEFYGIDTYVEKILQQVQDQWSGPMNQELLRKEQELLLLLALCDLYGQTGLPRFLVNKKSGLGEVEYCTHSYADSAFLISTFSHRDNKGVDIYQSKHYLLSEKLLEKGCQQLYGAKPKDCLSTLAQALVDFLYDACTETRNYDSVNLDILERLFISKNSDDYNQHFSQLIMEIALPSERKRIMEDIAKKFSRLAEKDRAHAGELYRMAAHFYGHLARLCSRREGDIQNMEDAERFGKKAVELMEKADCGTRDFRIYHMCGDACKRALVSELEWLQEEPSPEEYEVYEARIQEIVDIYDLVAIYGSEGVACNSKTDLYIRYLSHVYRWKKIQQPEQLEELSETQVSYLTEIETLLDAVAGYQEKEDVQSECRKLEARYRSDILLGDYGAAVEYYEALIRRLERSRNSDTALQNARRGLIGTQMQRFNSQVRENPDQPVTMDEDALRKLLKMLEETLDCQLDPNDYRQRNQQIVGYARWFQLAKMKGSLRGLDQALQYAENWRRIAPESDPRPYYYLYVLSMLKGDRTAVGKYQKVSYERSRLKGHSIDTIRDVLVDGADMSQLLDLRYARNPVTYLENSKREPKVFSGSFNSISGNKGQITIKGDRRMEGEQIRFSMGVVNSVGEPQRSHILGTFVGFSYEQMEAVNKYVRDYTTGEPVPVLEKGGAAPNTGGSRGTPARETPVAVQTAAAAPAAQPEPAVPAARTASGAVAVLEREAAFRPYPAEITDVHVFQDKDDHLWLNGKLKGLEVGIPIDRDLDRYGNKALEFAGGLADILRRLERRGTVPCVILEKKGFRCQASLFETGLTLEELLREKGSAPAVEAAQPEEKKPAFPIRKGSPVKVILKRIEGTLAHGSFSYDGGTYEIQIPLKDLKKKDLERVKKAVGKTPIQAQITSDGYPIQGKLRG